MQQCTIIKILLTFSTSIKYSFNYLYVHFHIHICLFIPTDLISNIVPSVYLKKKKKKISVILPTFPTFQKESTHSFEKKKKCSKVSNLQIHSQNFSLFKIVVENVLNDRRIRTLHFANPNRDRCHRSTVVADFRSAFADSHGGRVNIDTALGEHVLHGCPLHSRKTFAGSQSCRSVERGEQEQGARHVQSEADSRLPGTWRAIAATVQVVNKQRRTGGDFWVDSWADGEHATTCSSKGPLWEYVISERERERERETTSRTFQSICDESNLGRRFAQSQTCLALI